MIEIILRLVLGQKTLNMPLVMLKSFYLQIELWVTVHV